MKNSTMETASQRPGALSWYELRIGIGGIQGCPAFAAEFFTGLVLRAALSKCQDKRGRTLRAEFAALPIISAAF